MATKKNISDFESALLSNTKIIKNTQIEQIQTNDIQTNAESAHLISAEMLEKYTKLAEREQIELKELIALALNHFLNMEQHFFEA